MRTVTLVAVPSMVETLPVVVGYWKDLEPGKESWLCSYARYQHEFTHGTMTEGNESQSGPLLAGRSGIPVPVMSQGESCWRFEGDLRATAERLGRSPYRLGAVKAQDVEPLFESLYARPNIVQGSIAVITATVTEVWRACCVPHRRPCSVHTNRISILHQISDMRMIKYALNAPHVERYLPQ